MIPLLASNAVTVALMSALPGNGSFTFAEPVPMTLLGQAGLPPAWIISSSVALQTTAPFESTAVPAGNLMLNVRTDFGWPLFAVFEASDDSVTNDVPTDLPAFAEV